jgi:hypothetical protein
MRRTIAGTRSSRAARCARAALACALIGAAISATPSASASTSIRSPLPDFPRFSGVLLVHNHAPASIAREKAIRAAVQRESESAGTIDPAPNCTLPEVNPGVNLCWFGGPVLPAHTVHLIFWEGPGGHPFAKPYEEAIENYFERVAAASGANSNVYAVGSQYGDTERFGVYGVSFSKAADVYRDTERPLPASGTLPTQCTDPAAEGETEKSCVTDNALREEVERAENSTYGKTNEWKSSLAHAYFVFTPSKVGGCFLDKQEETEKGKEQACAFAAGGYCAYHSHLETEKEPSVYGSIPDSANVGGCDSFEHPSGAEGVDGSIDAASHEHNEMITDPLANAWHDVAGNEMADKCVPPLAFEENGGLITGIYGVKLGGKPSEVFEEGGKLIIKAGTLYNQRIGAGQYWLQTEWSNRATEGGGACEQRMLPVEFSPPGGARAQVPTAFNGGASGEPGDPAKYWVWNFGDEMQSGTPEATASHTYALPGLYRVTLTAYDGYGNSNTVSKFVTVGAAPPPPPPPTTTTTTITTATTVTVNAAVTSYSSSELAAKLGLPGAGAKLAGLGTITFGHGGCPPACSVSAKLYTKVKSTNRHHRGTKTVLIGTVSLTIANGGTGTIALTLNANGRSLLRGKHHLACQLQLTVTGAEGGSWQIVRSYTLNASGGKSSRRRLRRR